MRKEAIYRQNKGTEGEKLSVPEKKKKRERRRETEKQKESKERRKQIK